MSSIFPLYEVSDVNFLLKPLYQLAIVLSGVFYHIVSFVPSEMQTDIFKLAFMNNVSMLSNSA